MSEPELKVAAPGPVAGADRIAVLDVLRGFALLWIFTFNVFIFCGYEFMSDTKAQALSTFQIDTTVKFLRHLFIENKDFSLFSFLFGIGFGLMTQRTAAAERSVIPHFLRRQGVLLAFGLVHAILLWGGDILIIYALLGLLLIPFLKASPRVLLVSAVVVYLLPIPLYALSIAIQPPAPFTIAAEWTGQPNLFGIWMKAFATGDYVQVVKGNLAFLAFWWTMFTFNLYWPDVLGMFLIGLYVVRARWLERIEKDPSLLPGKLVVWAGALGICGNIVFAILTYRGDYYPPSSTGMILTLVQYTTVPMLCFFYMVGLTWLFLRPGWQTRLEPLAAVGRMTLTNYLLQSLICIFVFYGIGFGLFGKVGATYAVLIAWAIFGLQIVFSRWWWSRDYLFGPAEWLWRRLTYGGQIPLRKP